MKKILLLIGACVLLILCMSGCGSSGNSHNRSESTSQIQTSDDRTSPKETSSQETSATDTPDTSKSDNIYKVCIDPGHQGKGNNDLEPIGPGSDEKKKKVSYGTQGVSTGIAEYVLNLEVSLMLREELIKRGYDVFMIRETNDVDISNMERAIMGNESGSDISVRIHANGSENQSVNGALTIYPSENNPYVAHLSADSKRLSEAIIDNLCERTGAKNRGAIARDNYTGSNWSVIPVTIVEMGYMSNPEEDELMATEDYKNKLVQGIADGIDEYFKK